MSEKRSTKIRVIRPKDVIWEDALRTAEETEASGQEFVSVQSVPCRIRQAEGRGRRGCRR